MTEVLIVTGMSGAGKSSALRVLEDLGYLCVDNLPGDLMGNFIELCHTNDPPIERVALVIDSRASVFRYSTESLFKTLDGLNDAHPVPRLR